MSFSSSTNRNSLKEKKSRISEENKKLVDALRPILQEGNIKLCKRIDSKRNKSASKLSSLPSRLAEARNKSKSKNRNSVDYMSNDYNLDFDSTGTVSTILSNIKLNFIQEKKTKGDTIYKQLNIPPSLLCFLCKKIITDAVKCYKCKTLFCHHCIFTFTKKTHKCPKCFNIVNMKLMESVDIKEEYDKFIVKCPFAGCQDKINLNTLLEHVTSCAFRNVKEEARRNVDRFTLVPYEEDPYTKTHLLNFLNSLNEEEVKYKSSLVMGSQPFRADERLAEFIEISNNKLKEIQKSIDDIANITKVTNDKIKKELKH